MPANAAGAEQAAGENQRDVRGTGQDTESGHERQRAPYCVWQNSASLLIGWFLLPASPADLRQPSCGYQPRAGP